MADGTEDIKLSTVTHIPRLMLWIVAINLILWLGILPALYGLTHGRVEWFQVAVVGLLLVPISLMMLFIGRLVYYFMTLFYWYFQGCLALFGILLAGTYLVAALTPASPPPFGFSPERALNLLPDGILSRVSGIILVIAALLAVFLLGRLTARKGKVQPPTLNSPATVDPLVSLGAEQQKIRQQIAQRSQRVNPPPKP